MSYEIIGKLLAKSQRYPAQGGGSMNADGSSTSYITDDGKRLVNPDGPQAAAVIEALAEALKQSALDLHEAAGRFAAHSKLDLLACSELTREAARQADSALAQLQNRSGGEG